METFLIIMLGLISYFFVYLWNDNQRLKDREKFFRGELHGERLYALSLKNKLESEKNNGVSLAKRRAGSHD